MVKENLYRTNNKLEKEYRKAIGIDPNDAVAHNNLGNSLVNLNRYDEAEKKY